MSVNFFERHGLIVIIALGETLIVAASGLVGTPRAPIAMTTGVLAVAVTCGLWWTSFCYARSAFEHELAAGSVLAPAGAAAVVGAGAIPAVAMAILLPTLVVVAIIEATHG